MRNNRLKYLLIMGIVLTLIAGLGATYSFFIYRETGSNVSLETGEISINYSNNVNYLTVPDAYPVSDTIGKIYPYYNDFTVNATTDNQAIQYEIQIIPRNNNTIDGKYIKVYLTDQNDNPITEPTLYTNLSDATHNAGKTVYTGYATKTSAKNFRLRVWIDESYTKNQKETFGFNIYLYAVNSETDIKLLYDTIETSLAANLTEPDVDGTRYVNGETVDNNYVWYSGKMWRIVALNSDGTVKLVTQNAMTSVTWYADSNNTNYNTSQVRTWLKNEFLSTIKSDLIVDSKWDYTTYESFPTSKISENQLTVTDKVGLLSIYDYMMTGGTVYSSTSKTFLNIGYSWWTMSPSIDNKIWYVDSYNYATKNTQNYDFSVRPSVNMKSDVKLNGSGNGEIETPYMLEGDTKIGQANEQLLTRLSGEYIKINNVKYRIVGIENGLTKVTMADYDINQNTLSTSVQFGASSDEATFSSTYGIGKYLDDWYNATTENDTNGTYTGLYLSTDTKAMIATPNDGVRWYAGPDSGIVYDYTKAKDGTSIEATIGLGRYGEMFSTQFGLGISLSTNTWLISKYNTSYIWRVNNDGNGYRYILTDSYGVRPSFYLKSDVKITGGTGMPHDAYTISQ